MHPRTATARVAVASTAASSSSTGSRCATARDGQVITVVHGENGLRARGRHRASAVERTPIDGMDPTLGLVRVTRRRWARGVRARATSLLRTRPSPRAGARARVRARRPRVGDARRHRRVCGSTRAVRSTDRRVPGGQASPRRCPRRVARRRGCGRRELERRHRVRRGGRRSASPDARSGSRRRTASR